MISNVANIYLVYQISLNYKKKKKTIEINEKLTAAF